MNVFPESMNKINVNDPKTALAQIERYLKYIMERVEFSTNGIVKTVSANMTPAEVAQQITEMRTDMTSALSTIATYSARINTLEYNTAGLSDLEDEVDTQRGAISDLTDAVDLMSADVEDIQDDITDISGDITGIQGDVTSLQTGKADKSELYSYAPVITDTVLGAVANFPDGAAGYPLKHLIIEIDYSQGGSGDASPDNVRPILGMLGTSIMTSGADTSNPETTSISWQTEAGTVYKGTLDIATGEMIINWKMVTYKGSTSDPISWSSMNQRMEATASDAYTNGSMRQTVISDMGTFDDSGTGEGVVYIDNTAGGTLYYYPPSTVTDLASLKTWLSSNNLHCLYKLATPERITVTPTEFKTLLGENNIWAASGDVMVEYCADTKLYISRMLR